MIQFRRKPLSSTNADIPMRPQYDTRNLLSRECMVARWFIRPATGLKPDGREMPLRIAGQLFRSSRALHVDAARDGHDVVAFNACRKPQRRARL
jgi:hypothetical protein